MGITNKGAQLITWDFKHPAKGYAFNQAFRGWTKPGIYEGLTLSIDTGNNIILSPGHAVLNAEDVNRGKDNIAIKVEFQSTNTETINQTTPAENEIVYLYFEYIDQVQDWVDIFHDSISNYLSSPPANAVVVGEITYDGGGTATGFDYTRRTYGLLSVAGGYSLNSSTPFSDTIDPTKQLQVNLSNITTGNTRTITYPDIDTFLGSSSNIASLENIDSQDIHTVSELQTTGSNSYYGTSVTNAPSSSLFYFSVDKKDINNIKIEASNQTETEIYIKQKVSGVWGTWSSSSFTATDISGGNVYAIRHGRFYGSNLTNSPDQTVFWGTRYTPDDTTTYGGQISKVVSGLLWVIGGQTSSAGTATTAIHYYNFETKTWNISSATLPSARMFAGGSVYLDRYIYIICGTDDYNNAPVNTIYRLDTSTEVVDTITPVSGTVPSRVSPMVSDPVLIGTDDIIVIAGGYNSSFVATDTIYWYNITNNTVVTKTATLPTTRGGATANTVNGELYMAGGSTTATAYWYAASGVFYTTILVYDPNNPVDDATAITTLVANLENAKAYIISEVYNNNIYYYGGTDSSNLYNDIQKLNTGTGNLTLLSQTLPRQLFGGSAGILKNNILIIGGYLDRTATTTRETSFDEFYVIDTWYLLYEQVNDTTIKITATDSYVNWKGQAIKYIYNVFSSPLFGAWEYSDLSSITWYTLTLRNGWTSTGLLRIGKTCEGLVIIRMDRIINTAATANEVAIVPPGYRPSANIGSIKTVVTQSTGGNSMYITINSSGSLAVFDYTLFTGSAYTGELVYKAEA